MQWDRAWDMLNLQLQLPYVASYTDLLGADLRVRVQVMEHQSCCIGSDGQCDTCDILSSFLTTTYQLHSIR